MKPSEFEEFCEKHPHIEWTYNGDTDEFAFRDTQVSYYVNHPEACTIVRGDTLQKLDFNQLVSEINRGLRIEQISRVTGYFSKISQWNLGKRGELNDRSRSQIA
jgi:hypothetical protein